MVIRSPFAGREAAREQFILHIFSFFFNIFMIAKLWQVQKNIKCFLLEYFLDIIYTRMRTQNHP